jgi:hypothetical protein
MHEKKFITLITGLAIILAAVAAYIIFTRQVAAPERNTSDVMTISGTIACLPKTGTGNQTMECAIGLQGNGKYYSLKNMSQHDPENKFSATGQHVEVTGTIKADASKSPYDIAGTIDVTSIKETK